MIVPFVHESDMYVWYIEAIMVFAEIVEILWMNSVIAGTMGSSSSNDRPLSLGTGL